MPWEGINWEGVDLGNVQVPGSVGSTPPPSGYPNIAGAGELVELDAYPGVFYDAWTGKFYDASGKEIPAPSGVNVGSTKDPKGDYTNRPGPTEPGGLGSNVAGPPPTDGPLPGAPGGQPGPSVTYLGTPNGWSGSGPYELANPMPAMPGVGTTALQPYQAWSLRQGQSGGPAPAFTPWGSPMGQVSNILRYGGSPSVTSQGGRAGSVGVPRPPMTGGGGGPGFPGTVGTPPGGGGLPGRTGGTGGTGGTLPPGGGGSGLPGRVNNEIDPNNPLTWPDSWAKQGLDSWRDQGGGTGINPLNADQIRLILATNGSVLEPHEPYGFPSSQGDEERLAMIRQQIAARALRG